MHGSHNYMYHLFISISHSDFHNCVVLYNNDLVLGSPGYCPLLGIVSYNNYLVRSVSVTAFSPTKTMSMQDSRQAHIGALHKL